MRRTASCACSPNHGCSAGRHSRSWPNRPPARCTRAAWASLNADIVFAGRTAHSARPWEGENAITAAAPFLVRAAAATTRPVEVDGLRFHDTLAVTQAHGGIARNVVPDRFVLSVNMRFAPGRDMAAARARARGDGERGAEVDFVDEAPAGTARRSTIRRCARSWSRAASRFTRSRPGPTSPRCRRPGIPAVNYGPGDAGPGTPAGRVGRRGGDRRGRRDADRVPRRERVRLARSTQYPTHARREVAGAREPLRAGRARRDSLVAQRRPGTPSL